MTNQPAEPHNATTSSQGQFQAQQEISLEPFYEELLKLNFADSITAIEHCRDLCAQYGFTVKQESSMHRNIYVYCSREGLPDSQRNPKSAPKRKRPSKRCDCRWRVVLYEREGRWQFRKSLNPEAAKHNHELMRPEEIDRNWPRKVIDMIYELARTNLPTADIRAKVQAEFPDISWNERRFYNRLSEERTKIRHREAAARARHLTSIWTRVCMAVAGNEELSRFVESEILNLLHTTCQMARLDPNTLVAPSLAEDASTSAEQQQQQQQPTAESSQSAAQSSASAQTRTEPMPQVQQRRSSKQASNASKDSDAPKGFIKVTIPEHSFNVKIHNQKIVNEIAKQSRKSRSTDPAAEHDSIRKLPRLSQSSSQPNFPYTSAALYTATTEHHSVYPQPSSSSSFVYQYGDTAGMSLQRQQHNHHHHQEQQQQQQQQAQSHQQAAMPYGFTRFQPPAQPTFQHPTGYPATTPLPIQYTPAPNEPTIHPALQSDPPPPRQQEEEFQELLLSPRRQHRSSTSAFTATSTSSPTPNVGMYVPQQPPTT